jgi:hypothetical protein
LVNDNNSGENIYSINKIKSHFEIYCAMFLTFLENLKMNAVDGSDYFEPGSKMQFFYVTVFPYLKLATLFILMVVLIFMFKSLAGVFISKERIQKLGKINFLIYIK